MGAWNKLRWNFITRLLFPCKEMHFCSVLDVLMKSNCYQERIVAAVLPLISLPPQKTWIISALPFRCNYRVHIYMCLNIRWVCMPFVVNHMNLYNINKISHKEAWTTSMIILVMRSWLKRRTTLAYILLQHVHLVKLLLRTLVRWTLAAASPPWDSFIAIHLKHGEVITST